MLIFIIYTDARKVFLFVKCFNEKNVFYFTNLCWKYSENKVGTYERKIGYEIT